MPRKRTGGIDTRDGRVYARVTVTLADGRKARRRVRLDNRMTRREAKAEAKKLSREASEYVFDPRRKVQLQKPTAATSLTVDEYHDAWAEDRERRGKVSERGRYKVHVQPFIGTKQMRAVTDDDARWICAELDEKVLAKELHWSTASKVWGVVGKMFKDATRSKVAHLRVLKANPFADIPGPDRGQKRSKQWLYPSEALKLLACPEVPQRWAELYALSIYLYTRPEELAVLTAADVNLEHGYVSIHRAVDLRTGDVKPTKTKHTRKVPIPLALRPLLERLIKEAPAAGRLIRSTHANRKVEGHGLPPVEDLAATLREHLQRAGVTRADLFEQSDGTKRITFYDLRATGITWEALAKTDTLTIMQRAGHTEYKTTLGYIREAEAVGYEAGEPFPALPARVVDPPKGPRETAASSSQVANLPESHGKVSVPNGIRTRVTALKGPCPGPG